MSARTTTITPGSPAPETVTTGVVSALVDVFGGDTVREILDTVAGPVVGELASAALLVAGDVVRALVARVGADAVKAALDAQFEAVDAEMDALENAKFPRGGS